jgi:hypothetical protein
MPSGTMGCKSGYHLIFPTSSQPPTPNSQLTLLVGLFVPKTTRQNPTSAADIWAILVGAYFHLILICGLISSPARRENRW